MSASNSLTLIQCVQNSSCSWVCTQIHCLLGGDVMFFIHRTVEYAVDTCGFMPFEVINAVYVSLISVKAIEQLTWSFSLPDSEY